MNAFERKTPGKLPNIKMDQVKPRKSTGTITSKFKKNSNALYYLHDFTENVSFGGLKYLGEKGRSLVERIFWLIIIIIAISLSVILIRKSFLKWQNSPIIVTLSTEQQSIYDIPFPAITICSQIKTSKMVLNYTDLWIKKYKKQELTLDEIFEFDTISLICNQELDNDTDKFTDVRAIELMYEVHTKVEKFMWEAHWIGIPQYNTYMTFVPVLTSEGICYTFNGYNASVIFSDEVQFDYGQFWKFDSTIESDLIKSDGYPYRTPMVGVKGGLELKLNGKLSDMEYICNTEFVDGFKIAIHDPAELPRIEENYFQVPINQAVSIAIKPIQMTTSEDLLGYTPQDRKCYLPHEKKLDYFKIYNQNNCLFECLTKSTLRKCDCVNFYMPKNASTRICGSSSQRCANTMRDEFSNSETIKGKIEINKERTRDVIEKYIISCDCLPACYSLDFDVQISQSDWKLENAIEKLKTVLMDNAMKQERFPDNDFFTSKVMIYFKNRHFTASERNELYGYAEFWSNVGGILGLFTGFSFITIFEILYYLFLRPTCNIKTFGRRGWSGSPITGDECTCNKKTENETLDTKL